MTHTLPHYSERELLETIRGNIRAAKQSRSLAGAVAWLKWNMPHLRAHGTPSFIAGVEMILKDEGIKL